MGFCRVWPPLVNVLTLPSVLSTQTCPGPHLGLPAGKQTPPVSPTQTSVSLLAVNTPLGPEVSLLPVKSWNPVKPSNGLLEVETWTWVKLPVLGSKISSVLLL